MNDPDRTLRHRRCVSQDGLELRTMLCGEIRTGERPRPSSKLDCRVCLDLAIPHGDECEDCEEAGRFQNLETIGELRRKAERELFR